MPRPRERGQHVNLKNISSIGNSAPSSAEHWRNVSARTASCERPPFFFGCGLGGRGRGRRQGKGGAGGGATGRGRSEERRVLQISPRVVEFSHFLNQISFLTENPGCNCLVCSAHCFCVYDFPGYTLHAALNVLSSNHCKAMDLYWTW